MKESAKKKLLKKDRSGLRTNPLETRAMSKIDVIDDTSGYFAYKKYSYKHTWKEEYADDIYEIIANGGALTDIARKYEISPRLAWSWVTKDMPRYQESMAIRATLRVETMFVLADELVKGKIDPLTFKAISNMVMWVASKEGSNMYKDQQNIASTSNAKLSYVSFLEDETVKATPMKEIKNTPEKSDESS